MFLSQEMRVVGARRGHEVFVVAVIAVVVRVGVPPHLLSPQEDERHQAHQEQDRVIMTTIPIHRIVGGGGYHICGYARYAVCCCSSDQVRGGVPL